MKCPQGPTAAIAAALGPHPLAGVPGKRLEGLRCDGRAAAFDRVLGSLCVRAGLVANGLEFRNSVLQHWIGEIGNAVLDCVVEALELGIGLGRALAQLGDVRGATPGTFLPSIEHGGEDFLEARGLQKPPLDVIGHESIQPVHRHRPA